LDNARGLLVDLFKIIVSCAVGFVTLGAIILFQVFGLYGQVAVPTPKPVFPFRQQDEIVVPT
jgi:hypothetical protein